MKRFVGWFVVACFLAFPTRLAAQKPFSMQIAQGGKVVTPDSRGITHLRKAPFELVFNLQIKLKNPTPLVSLHLSTDSVYYDMIRAGKSWPFALDSGCCSMAEAENPPSDDLVVYGKMPVYKVHTPPDPNEPSFDQPVVGVHFLVDGHFNSCTALNGSTCVRKALKLALGKDNDDKSSGFPVVTPGQFPPKAIYVSAVSLDLPEEEKARASATAIIQFTE